MASFTLTDAYVSVASNDLSAYVTSVTVNYSAEIQDNSAMGNTSRSRVAGLTDWSLELEFNQDFAAGALDSIMFPLVGTAVAVEVRPTSSAVSTSNPKYTGTGIVESFPPLGNAVGEVATTSTTIQCSNGTALARATS